MGTPFIGKRRLFVILSTEFVPTEAFVPVEVRVAGARFRGIWGDLDSTIYVFAYERLPADFDLTVWERSLQGSGYSRRDPESGRELFRRRTSNGGNTSIEEVRCRADIPARRMTITYMWRPTRERAQSLRAAGYGPWIDKALPHDATLPP
jgi:hypothetical protein